MRRATRDIRESKKIRLPSLKFPMPDWRILALVGLALLLAIINFVLIPSVKSTAPPKLKQQHAAEISESVRTVLSEYGLQPEMAPGDTTTQVVYPQDFDFFALYKTIRSRLAVLDAEILTCQKIGSSSILMSVGKNGQHVEHFLFVKSRRLQLTRGRVALIIDDFGYSFNDVTRDFLALNIPLTISIIPGLAYSKKVAEIAQLQRKKILIHMPMEPLNESYDDNGFTLISGQDPGMVSLRVRRAFAHLPAADGMNNHQGSKATVDAEMMQTLMSTLKSLNKFFIDSRTNVNSIAYATAQRFGVPSNKNDFFIDVTDDVGYVEKQLLHLANVAKEQGQVIAIGHVRPNTLRALQRSMSKMKTMGITFVYASDILN